MTEPSNSEEIYWLDDMRNVRKIIWILLALCTGLLVAEGFYLKKPYFNVESWFGFYAFYGFFMCVGLVLAAKVMRFFLMRDEDFYDNDGDDN